MHTPAALPRPYPTISPPSTPKTVSPSCAARSRHYSTHPHTRPTMSPRLRHFSPSIRPDPAFSPGPLTPTYICAIIACARDRPRRRESLPPMGIMPQASVGASETGLRPPTRTLSCSATRGDTCAQKSPARRYSLARDRRHSQLRTQQNVAESSRFRFRALAGAKVLAAPGHLKQSRRLHRWFRRP